MKRIYIVLTIIILTIVGLYVFAPKDVVVKENLYKISLQQIDKNISDGSLLIDVRTAEEYKVSHAEGAINLPLADIQKGEFPKVDKNKIVYLYCRTGNRAGQAKTILEQAGYSHVINIASLDNWVALGGKAV